MNVDARCDQRTAGTTMTVAGAHVVFHLEDDVDMARSQPSSSPTSNDPSLLPDIAALHRDKALKDLEPSSVAVKLLSDSFALAADMFKLAMASMLSVVVPQTCPPSANASSSVDTCDECSCDVAAHECSFGENFRCLTRLNVFVLSWNFLCLLVLVFHYFLVWRREYYIIRHFRESSTVGRLHVRQVIGEHPRLEHRLKIFNRAVFATSLIAIVLQCVNLVSSGVLLFVYYSAGYKTFTTYFTNLLLIGVVLYNCINASYVGMKHNLAFSAVAFEPLSYNVVASHIPKSQRRPNAKAVRSTSM